MLRIGDEAPDFELEDDSGNRVRLSEALRSRSVVLYFYPMDFMPVCTREACMFRDVFSELASLGIRVFGVSSQSPGVHARFRAFHRLPFPLLSDPGRKVARAYGCLGFLGLTVRRASFWIGEDSKIRDAALADFRVRPHEEFARRVLEKARTAGA
ncbi:MAG: peroxiredoxin [Planctomycetota bacterium]